MCISRKVHWQSAEKAETGGIRNNTKTLYNISKKLAGKYRRSEFSGKDKDGNTIQVIGGELKRWTF